MSNKNTKALVTVIIGDELKEWWSQKIHPTWIAYAEKYGYDIVVIEDFIDKTLRAQERTINWQKLLIMEYGDVSAYEDVVWMDCDVMINYHRAPCIVSANDPEKVGLVSYRDNLFDAVETYDNLTLRTHNESRFGNAAAKPHSIKDWYTIAGLDESVEDVANTGVIVLKPALHREVLKTVYDDYEENPGSAKEEFPLSNHLFKRQMVHRLDRRFNWSWWYHLVERYPFIFIPEYVEDMYAIGMAVNAAYANTWFLHFTGETPRFHARLVATNIDGAYNGAKSFRQFYLTHLRDKKPSGEQFFW